MLKMAFCAFKIFRDNIWKMTPCWPPPKIWNFPYVSSLFFLKASLRDFLKFRCFHPVLSSWWSSIHLLELKIQKSKITPCHTLKVASWSVHWGYLWSSLSKIWLRVSKTCNSSHLNFQLQKVDWGPSGRQNWKVMQKWYCLLSDVLKYLLPLPLNLSLTLKCSYL